MALAIPAPLSFFHPTWWATHRLAAVTLLRVVCCLACVVQVTIAEASVAGAGTLHELQRYACTLSMIMCSLWCVGRASSRWYFCLGSRQGGACQWGLVCASVVSHLHGLLADADGLCMEEGYSPQKEGSVPITPS